MSSEVAGESSVWLMRAVSAADEASAGQSRSYTSTELTDWYLQRDSILGEMIRARETSSGRLGCSKEKKVKTVVVYRAEGFDLEAAR